VDLTTPVIGGQLALTPAEGIPIGGGLRFSLTHANVLFAGFSVNRSCRGFADTRNYTQVGVQLARAVSFTATGGPTVFAFTIPKGDFLIYESLVVNGGADSAYKHPREDVTGTIDFGADTVSLHIMVGARVHFEAGCTSLGCIIKEDKDGMQTADVSGGIVFPDADGDGVPDRTDNCRFTPNPDQTPVPTPVIAAPADITLASCADPRIGVAKTKDVCDARPVTVTNDAPGTFAIGANLVTWSANDGVHPVVTAAQHVTVVDTTPPTVTCVPARSPGGTFRVSASDACPGAPVIGLGTFVLANGERIKIQEVGQSGVQFVGTVGPNHIRHFQVGKGENIITATDASRNAATAVCR
jgi:hypothetical protein